jgi:flagellar M-ring protein FliF
VALLLLGLVGPVIKGRKQESLEGGPRQPGAQLDAVAGEELQRPALPAPVQAQDLQPTEEQLRLEEARQLARSNPVAVASILKTWVNGE